MEIQSFKFRLDFDWTLLGMLSSIDRFDAAWSSIEKKEGQGLKQLRTMATVQSTGASTRIEGSKMSDEEIDALLQNINISKLQDRDEQEALGYFEALNMILDSYDDIRIGESEICSLHNTLLKHSEKDHWHKGKYKQLVNSVEATAPDGTSQIIFRTTDPGIPTQVAMGELMEWYDEEEETHPLVKCAMLTYEFVSIHPFQDGNGRMSRLLSLLSILKHGYTWVQYVSLEHEIERQKKEYYLSLRKCQAHRPNENITPWVVFFLQALKNIQEALLLKLQATGIESQLSPKEKAILAFVSNHPGCRSGDIARRLNIPNPTVKRILTQLVDQNLIERFGAGPGTNYAMA